VCWKCHPLTTAVHKLEETLSLARSGVWIRLFLPTKPYISQSRHDRARTVWHLEETTRSSAKMLGGAGHHEQRALSFWCLECCDGSVSMEGATTRRRSSLERERVCVCVSVCACMYVYTLIAREREGRFSPQFQYSSNMMVWWFWAPKLGVMGNG